MQALLRQKSDKLQMLDPTFDADKAFLHSTMGQAGADVLEESALEAMGRAAGDKLEYVSEKLNEIKHTMLYKFSADQVGAISTAC